MLAGLLLSTIELNWNQTLVKLAIASVPVEIQVPATVDSQTKISAFETDQWGQEFAGNALPEWTPERPRILAASSKLFSNQKHSVEGSDLSVGRQEHMQQELAFAAATP